MQTIKAGSRTADSKTEKSTQREQTMMKRTLIENHWITWERTGCCVSNESHSSTCEPHPLVGKIRTCKTFWRMPSMVTSKGWFWTDIHWWRIHIHPTGVASGALTLLGDEAWSTVTSSLTSFQGWQRSQWSSWRGRNSWKPVTILWITTLDRTVLSSICKDGRSIVL